MRSRFSIDAIFHVMACRQTDFVLRSGTALTGTGCGSDQRREMVRSMQRVGPLPLLFAWLALFDPGFAVRTCRSELIYFHKGGEAQLPATIEGNRIVLSLPDGKVELSRDGIRKVVPGFWPASEWETRRQQVRASGPETRFAAAWWAIENGLTTEVAAELRAIHALDPKHLPAARMTAVLDQLGASVHRSRFRPLSEGTRNRHPGGPRTSRAFAAPAFRRRSRRASRTS